MSILVTETSLTYSAYKSLRKIFINYSYFLLNNDQLARDYSLFTQWNILMMIKEVNRNGN
jgi:hypothetical protein